MNECDALESNNAYAGWESKVNIPAITGSPYGISLALVKLTYPEQLTGLLPDDSPLNQMRAG